MEMYDAQPLDFERDVLEASRIKPVLVDFWASWCGPCRMLGPVLDELAKEQADRWSLVKVDTEARQDLASRYQIRSIPHVKLFSGGREVADFSGALPKTSIQKWLDDHLPDECRTAWTELMDASPAWPDPSVAGNTEELLSRCPDHLDGRVFAAALVVIDDPAAALALVTGIRPDQDQWRRAEAVREIGRLLAFTGLTDNPASPALIRARDALRNRDLVAATEALLEAIRADRTADDDLPRKAMLGIFALHGEQQELTRKYRPWFAMALN